MTAAEGFLVREVVVLGVLVAGDLLAGHAQLHQVRTQVDVPPDGLAHLLGTVGEGGDALDQGAAGDRDFLTVRQVAGAGDLAGVDGVADDHIQSRLGGRGTDAHGVAGVDVGLRRAGTQQGVLFDAHRPEAGQVGGVDPGEVGVSITQTRHQELALAVDDPRAFARQISGALADLGNAFAFDQHFTLVRVGTGGVEDPNVGEKDGLIGGVG